MTELHPKTVGLPRGEMSFPRGESKTLAASFPREWSKTLTQSFPRKGPGSLAEIR